MNIMKPVAFGLISGFSALVFNVAIANATIVAANWFSNATTIINVLEEQSPDERLRLEGGFLSGSVEGSVTLPFVADWTIAAAIQNDGQFDIPEEFVKIFIDDFTTGNEVAEFFNTPLGATQQFSHSFTGDSFDYRFEFESTSTDFGSHLIVERGTVSTPVPEPGILAILAIGLVGLGIARRKRAA